MKQKSSTYFLLVTVMIVWGIIIYRIVSAAAAGDAPFETPDAVNPGTPFNDYTVKKDTSHLLLNYRDPFSAAKPVDTVKAKLQKQTAPVGIVTRTAAIDWSFIKYLGYVFNAGQKKTITLVSINGQTKMLADGEMADDVKLIRSNRDSIKVLYKKKIKFIKRALQ